MPSKTECSAIFLQPNSDKTEVLAIGSDTVASEVAKCIGSLSSAVQTISEGEEPSIKQTADGGRAGAS